MAHSLLQPPSEAEAGEYHEQLLAGHQPPRPPVAVRLDAGGGRGKGLFATAAIKQGDLIFAERALAGVQHLDSKEDTPACPQCFRALVTPERCVADILCGAIGHFSGDAHGHDSNSEGSDDSSAPEPLEAARRLQLIEAAVDAPMLEGLINGTRQLPMSDLITTPTPASCPGGCDERYCSSACAEAAWAAHHCLLCPVGRHVNGASGSGASGSARDRKGKGKAPAAAAPHSKKPGTLLRPGRAGGSGSCSGRGAKTADAEQEVCGVRLRRGRLAAFLEQADESNDYFRLAAQVLAMTLVAAEEELRKVKAQQQQQEEEEEQGEEQQQQEEESRIGGGAGTDRAAAECGGAEDEEALRVEALRRAWLRFAVAEKGPWWEVVGVEEGENEEEVRAQIRELTVDSLRLLKAAWVGTRWPELLQLEVYASVIGMFEQNNLAINIPSPAKVYLALPNDAAALPNADERAALEAELEPLRLAMGEDLEHSSVQGTAFYALQSCCNHSCRPAAAAEAQPSGEAWIVAVRDIAAGEEVTLSYIDDEETLSVAQRRSKLAEYGFVCRCERCAAEEAAQALAQVAL